jgi:phage terminase large subunit-like protein
MSEDLSKLPRQELIQRAMAATELMRRYNDEFIRWYKPCSEKHRSFHMSNAFIRIAFGGNQSGKSIMGLVELLYRACFKVHPLTKEVNPQPGKYRIFTTKFQIAEEHIIPLLKKYVPKPVLINGSWEESYDSRYHILRLRNGTIIDILTYDQEASVAESVTLDGIWADEEMPERFFSGSLPRLVARQGKFWMTVTPLYNLTWAMKYWNNADKDVFVTKIGIHDNPHLAKDFVETLINQWPANERAARVSGEFLEFSGIVYKELDSTVHLIHPSKVESSWPVVMALDPHPRKASVITWAYVTPQEDVVFFDELEVKGTAQDIVNAILAKEGSHKGTTQLRLIDPAADKQVSGIGSELTTLGEFQQAGMGFSLANNSDAGYNVVHEYLTWDKNFPISALNRPRCYVTTECPKTWAGMTGLMWEEWTHGRDLRDEKERVKDRKKDFPDCVRYTLAAKPSFNDRGLSSVGFKRGGVETKPRPVRDMILGRKKK